MRPDPIAWLFGLEQFGIKLGLDSITTILDAVGRPQESFTAVHVAGTNGKGSVTAMVDAALRAAGHRTGRYTSPHLTDLRERFVVDGAMVDEDLLAGVLTTMRGVVERLMGDGRLPAPPTFFEVTTAAAWEIFRHAGVGVAVCEVGLGGRLDATNVLTPRVCAITSIGLDHERHLGATIEAIAAEKAGILKPGTPVVVGRLPGEARRIVGGIAETVGAPLIDADADVRVETLPAAGPWEPSRVRLATPVHDYGEMAIALRGAHQIANASVAVRVLETLDADGVPVSFEATALGLGSAVWPGRLDRRMLADGREALLDAAHNPEGAAALARFLREIGPPRPLVFASMRDKDVAGMLRELAPVSSRLLMTRALNARSEDPAAIAAIARELAPELPVSVEPDPYAALDAAWRSSRSVVVAGSIFLIGDVMSRLGRS